ncbi:MAG: amn, partial [Ramlibacter sp.]|nr:amn [Ramlibacter sp.]
MPPFIAPTFHTDAQSALAQVQTIYAQQINHLREAMQRFVAGDSLPGRVRGCYPFVRIQTDSVIPQAQLENSGLSYGFVASAGRYETTLTRPDLYAPYYLEQFQLLLQNHGVPLEVGTSSEPMPIHFSFAEHDHIEGNLPPARRMMM